MQSAAVATVKHGDRLEILQRRRLFLRVRAPNGAEGWTEDRQLLGAADMTALRDLASRASKMPTQGQAFSFREMTLHTLPAAQSPSFFTIAPNDKVEVLAHMRTPRIDLPRRALIPPAPKKAKTGKQGNAKAPKYPPVPMPKPPAPPSNWLDLSQTDLSDEEVPPEEAPAPRVIPTDDWSLVRTPSGQSGWVLTRRLVMAIPDEVAQYAEGKRIVSYFPLATVMDGDEKKATWLWTTSLSGPQPYDFESFRVFVWNARRHRYETAWIARNVKGFSPVLVRKVEYGEAPRGRAPAATAQYPGFSICMEDDSGQKMRREYALLGNIVRYAGQQPCEAPGPPLAVIEQPGKTTAPPAAQQTAAPPPPTETFGQRIKKRMEAIKKGIFGK